MDAVKYNSINDRIVNEILTGKEEIKFKEKIDKETEETKTGSYNKIVGNLTSMTLRKYITNIINYHGLDLKVSNCNAFIEDCPIEWDLIILKNNAEDINNTNVFHLTDVVAVFEFKTSGLIRDQYKEIEKTFERQFSYINKFKKKNNKFIPFGYVTFAESEEWFNKTKAYFDSMNNKSNTAFAFLDYDLFERKDIKQYFPECNDFEKYLYNLLKLGEDNYE